MSEPKVCGNCGLDNIDHDNSACFEHLRSRIAELEAALADEQGKCPPHDWVYDACIMWPLPDVRR